MEGEWRGDINCLHFVTEVALRGWDLKVDCGVCKALEVLPLQREDTDRGDGAFRQKSYNLC